MDNTINQLKEWWSLGKFSSPFECTINDMGAGNYQITFYIISNNYHYEITVSPSHLSCTLATNTPLQGETHNRYADLSDGDFTKDTWLKILSDIISNETTLKSNYTREKSTSFDFRSFDFSLMPATDVMLELQNIANTTNYPITVIIGKLTKTLYNKESTNLFALGMYAYNELISNELISNELMSNELMSNEQTL